ncbi:MAG TPA: CBS domain-containing protein, partial [Desulfobacterales bacterium]|nr:CBS domain-containing protein [Desulfobacterales bacterium]
RPKHIHIWADMDDIDISGIIDTVCERARNVKVEDIMTTEVITVTPETHLFTILDIMLRKHVRRIPVIDKGTIVGIVYISDLFYFLYDKLAATGPQQNGSSRKT